MGKVTTDPISAYSRMNHALPKEVFIADWGVNIFMDFPHDEVMVEVVVFRGTEGEVKLPPEPARIFPSEAIVGQLIVLFG